VGDYEIVAGNPAKHIKYRFKREEIKKLKEIAWWNWPIDKIMDHRALMESSDIKRFIDNSTIFNEEIIVDKPVVLDEDQHKI
jgi:lipopolysaccharide transport system ATP-binding protein